MRLDDLRIPIIQAPLAGGASTPRLAAAVSGAGGFGFLAAGYKTPDAVAADIRELRSLTDQPFGVNVFAPPADGADEAGVARYANQLASEAERYGAALGEPRHDDDALAAKLELLTGEHVDVVSFTFGCPDREVIGRVHDAGCDVWVTVTSPGEALEAHAAGADALVVQGFEAGGHRGYFRDSDEAEDFGMLVLLRLITPVGLPLVAAGGIADGASIAAVLCAGATAAQLGTALMLTPEAGTSAPHRAALREGGPTALTRAFSGRQARGIANRFMREHAAQAPHAYPDVHHLTAPLRAAARKVGDGEGVNLWAGQAHALALEAPAAEIVERVWQEARRAARALGDRLT